MSIDLDNSLFNSLLWVPSMVEVEGHEELSREKYKAALLDSCKLVLADEIPPEGVDMLFIHGRAEGDEGTLFRYAKGLLNQGKVRQTVLPGSDGQAFDPNTHYGVHYTAGRHKYTAWPGRAEWSRRFDKVGVDLWKQPVYFVGAGVRTTKEENDSILAYAANNAIGSGASLAHSHQLLRAMLGMVATINAQSDLKVYTVHPRSTGWKVQVRGSQGANLKPRSEHARDEMLRVPRYQAKGDLATFAELRAYYNKRDSGLERLRGLLEQKKSDPKFQEDIRVMEAAIDSLRLEEIFV